MTSHTKKIMLFDFDGTIANSLPIGIQMLNELSTEFNYRSIEEKEIALLKHKTPAQLMKEFKIPLYKIPFIVMRVHALMKKRITEVEIFPGMVEVLHELKSKGLTLGIITSNAQDVVELFLQKYDVDDVFDFIHGEKNLFGKHKAFEKVIKKYQFVREEILYVGDEARDIEACKKVGIDVVSVTWGFNSAELLKQYDPEYCVDTVQELLTIV